MHGSTTDVRAAIGPHDPCSCLYETTDCTTLQGIRIDGIFFDEVPNQIVHLEYMQSISSFVRKTLAPTHPRTTITPSPLPPPGAESRPDLPASSIAQQHGAPLVIHNPGLFTDSAFYACADYVVVFENKLKEWQSAYTRINLACLSPELRAASVAIAHSSDEDCEDWQGAECHFAQDVVSRAGLAGHFVTRSRDYTALGSGWGAYVKHACNLATPEKTLP